MRLKNKWFRFAPAAGILLGIIVWGISGFGSDNWIFAMAVGAGVGSIVEMVFLTKEVLARRKLEKTTKVRVVPQSKR